MDHFDKVPRLAARVSGTYIQDVDTEPAMTRTKLFQSNRTQAVRLAKEVAFPPSVTEVTVIVDGPRRIIVPTNQSWDDFFDQPGIPDFPDRVQHPQAPRESFD